tara:strand:- start:3778 stop:4380 length:603 start_codon:yes stop_codon:yes gene_type:complete
MQPPPSPPSPDEEHEFVLSDPSDEILCGGVGRALRILASYPSGDSWSNALFDERVNEFAPTVLLYCAPKRDLQMFVKCLVFYLDLTSAELVTAYVLLESFLRAEQRHAAARHCVRLLMTACISLAVKTLTDTAITTRYIASIVRSGGFWLDSKLLCRMERMVLKTLDYRIIYQPEVYCRYSIELVRLYDPLAIPPDLGMR